MCCSRSGPTISEKWCLSTPVVVGKACAAQSQRVLYSEPDVLGRVLVAADRGSFGEAAEWFDSVNERFWYFVPSMFRTFHRFVNKSQIHKMANKELHD